MGSIAKGFRMVLQWNGSEICEHQLKPGLIILAAHCLLVLMCAATWWFQTSIKKLHCASSIHTLNYSACKYWAHVAIMMCAHCKDKGQIQLYLEGEVDLHNKHQWAGTKSADHHCTQTIALVLQDLPLHKHIQRK